MRIAIYGRHPSTKTTNQAKKVIEFLKSKEQEITIFNELFEDQYSDLAVFNDHSDLGEIDVMISLGGDGTLLNTLTVIRERETPVLGINTGRLGFLANVHTNRLEDALEAMLNGSLQEERRILIRASSDAIDFEGMPYALNEATLHKKDTSSMVSIHVEVDGSFMNNYWADGLIMCTPTGSTAYSLSCGGPIVMPGSDNFCITPIAPHNLNVRPMILSSGSKIKIKGEGREDRFFFTLDSRSFTVKSGTEIVLEKADHSMCLLNFDDQDFFSTIRNKMLWGMDTRN